MVEVSEETVEIAHRELDMLIAATSSDEPDPVTDDVFRARRELNRLVNESKSFNVSPELDATVSPESITLEKDDVELSLTPNEFEGLITEYIRAGGLR